MAEQACFPTHGGQVVATETEATAPTSTSTMMEGSV